MSFINNNGFNPYHSNSTLVILKFGISLYQPFWKHSLIFFLSRYSKFKSFYSIEMLYALGIWKIKCRIRFYMITQICYMYSILYHHYNDKIISLCSRIKKSFKYRSCLESEKEILRILLIFKTFLYLNLLSSAYNSLTLMCKCVYVCIYIYIYIYIFIYL